jgi:bacterial/archaeal transporter family-2 protein
VPRSLALFSTLAVGGLIALQPPANAALSKHVGDLGAALISAVIAVLILAVPFLLFGHPARLSGLAHFRLEHALGGLGTATVVLVSLITVRSLGVAGVASLIIAGELLISVVADRFGWFGVSIVHMTPGRWAGIVLVGAGTVLIMRP